MVDKILLMSLLNQDVHLLSYLIITLFGEFLVSKFSLGAAAPELLTSHLRIGDFFELRLKAKKPIPSTRDELSSFLVCQPVIPLGFEPRTLTLKV